MPRYRHAVGVLEVVAAVALHRAGLTAQRGEQLQQRVAAAVRLRGAAACTDQAGELLGRIALVAANSDTLPPVDQIRGDMGGSFRSGDFAGGILKAEQETYSDLYSSDLTEWVWIAIFAVVVIAALAVVGVSGSGSGYRGGGYSYTSVNIGGDGFSGGFGGGGGGGGAGGSSGSW